MGRTLQQQEAEFLTILLATEHRVKKAQYAQWYAKNVFDRYALATTIINVAGGTLISVFSAFLLSPNAGRSDNLDLCVKVALLVAGGLVSGISFLQSVQNGQNARKAISRLLMHTHPCVGSWRSCGWDCPRQKAGCGTSSQSCGTCRNWHRRCRMSSGGGPSAPWNRMRSERRGLWEIPDNRTVSRFARRSEPYSKFIGKGCEGEGDPVFWCLDRCLFSSAWRSCRTCRNR